MQGIGRAVGGCFPGFGVGGLGVEGMKRERKTIRFAIASDDIEISGTIASDAFGSIDPGTAARSLNMGMQAAADAVARAEAQASGIDAEFNAPPDAKRKGFACPLCGSPHWGESGGHKIPPLMPGDAVHEFVLGHCHGQLSSDGKDPPRKCPFTWIRSTETDALFGIELPEPGPSAAVATPPAQAASKPSKPSKK